MRIDPFKDEHDDYDLSCLHHIPPRGPAEDS